MAAKIKCNVFASKAKNVRKLDVVPLGQALVRDILEQAWNLAFEKAMGRSDYQADNSEMMHSSWTDFCTMGLLDENKRNVGQ